MSRRKRYVILGNGAAGVRAAEVLREFDKEGRITLLSREKEPYCVTPRLSEYIAGKFGEDRVCIKPPDFYQRLNIEALLGTAAVCLDPARGQVYLEDGRKLPYDQLLIATGASPRRLSVPGVERDGVVVLRTLQDARQIIRRVHRAQSAVVVGGGLVALELVGALQAHGPKVYMLVRSDRLWSARLDKGASTIIERHLAKKGVELRFYEEIKEILGNGHVSAVHTSSGDHIECQIVAMCIGVEPNLGFLEGSGILRDKAIIVDDRLRCNLDNVFAAGDVAQSQDRVQGGTEIHINWTLARLQGEVAAANMAGSDKVYEGGITVNTAYCYDLHFASMGFSGRAAEDWEELHREDPEKGTYKKVFVKENRIVGAILVGDLKTARSLERAITLGIDVSGLKDKLLEEDFNLRSILGPERSLAGALS